MEPSAKVCPTCQAPMEEGFIPDRGARMHRPIQTYRCTACAYLESYDP